MRGFFVGLLALGLAGCHAMPAVVGAGGAGIVAAAAGGTAVSVLSDVAKAGCAAQAAANAAADIATATHNAAWAVEFSKASRVAGYACAW